MEPTKDIVSKLWHLCNILRESGITYPEYVTELTYLLFLRMAEETKSEDSLPRGFRWRDLADKTGEDQFAFYKRLLRHLGTKSKGRVREIYADSTTCLKHSKFLSKLVDELDSIDWYAAREETALADVYEGLLEKNSTESKAGAGQYFTPRPVVECMVKVMRPEAGEIIQDPACGTAGFLISADRHIKSKTKGLKSLSKAEARFQREQAFVGVELVDQTHRLALMNATLHGIYSPILLGDALSPTGANLPLADLILTNPPFGTKKGGGLPERTDFSFPTSNKQLCFLQHIYRGLKPNGRAAVVLPDNVLFEENIAAQVRAEWMDSCDLHTILRLPTGIFYAPGVKTNVCFFTKGETPKGNTKRTWIYDMRTNTPVFGKRRPLETRHFEDFVRAFGSNKYGNNRVSQKNDSRFRSFSREEIRDRRENLDIVWMKHSDYIDSTELPEPSAIVGEVLAKLRQAVGEIEKLQAKVTRKK